MPSPAPIAPVNRQSLAAILTVALLQSMAYYGFLSVFVLYLMDPENGLDISFEEVGFTYGLSKYAIVFGLIVAGPLMDFALKKRKTLNLGLLILFSGQLLILIPDKTLFKITLMVMGLGIGMTRIGMYASLTDLLNQIPTKRSAGFVALTFVLNVGGFISPLLIFGLTDSENLHSTFLICAIFSLLAFGLSFFFLKGNDTIAAQSPGSRTSHVFLTIFIVFLAFTFWSIYGIYSNDLYHQVLLAFDSSEISNGWFSTELLQGLGSSLAIGLSILLLIALYFWNSLKTHWAILIGVFFLAFSVLGLYYLSPLSGEGSTPHLLFILFISALAEIIFAPFSIHYLTKYSLAKYLGCFIGLFLAGIQCSIIVGGLVRHDFEADLSASNFTLLAGLLALLLLIPVFFIGRYLKRQEAIEATPPLHLPE